ncbi:MAG: PqqD family protein [Dehalococcoidia bacterium]
MPYRRSPSVIFEVVDGRAMLVSADGSELLSLNPVGTRVWQLVDEHEGDSGRLASALLSEIEGVERDELERDIADFLSTLSSESLIEQR